jgi:signal transduction histidine kinase
MRERATRVGGRLNITSQPNFGTTVELRIPARLAYAPDPATSKPWFRRKAVNQE